MSRSLRVWIGLVAIACVAGGGCWYFTRTPRYSLWMIGRAIRDRDVALLERHVDVQQVAESFVDQVLAASEAPGAAEGPGRRVGRKLAAAVLRASRDRIVSKLKQDLLEAVRTGSLRKPDGEGAEGGRLHEVAGQTGLRPSTLNGIEYVREDGREARVGLRHRDEAQGRDFVLELAMRARDGRWQVYALPNLKDVLLLVRQQQEGRGPGRPSRPVGSARF